MRLKVLVVSHGVERAGAELSLIEIVAELQKWGIDVCVAVPVDGELTRRLNARSEPVQVVRIRTHRWMGARQSGLVGLFRLAQCIADIPAHYRLITNEQPDVVLINSSVAPAPLIASWLAGTNSVVTVRESIRTNPSLKSFLSGRIICWLISRLSSQVVCNSKFTADQFGHDCEIIYAQVSAGYAPKKARRVRSAGAPIRLVMLGTLSAEKGQSDAITAVYRARRLGALLRLDIYGDGPSSEMVKLQRQIEMLRCQSFVDLHPSVPDVAPLLNDADGTIVCSRNEAFGKVTCESLLFGVPVLGYNAGGTAEILRQGGGVVVEPDPDHMAEALARFCSEPHLRDELTQAAPTNAIARAATKSASAMAARVVGAAPAA